MRRLVQMGQGRALGRSHDRRAQQGLLRGQQGVRGVHLRALREQRPGGAHSARTARQAQIHARGVPSRAGHHSSGAAARGNGSIGPVAGVGHLLPRQGRHEGSRQGQVRRSGLREPPRCFVLCALRFCLVLVLMCCAAVACTVVFCVDTQCRVESALDVVSFVAKHGLPIVVKPSRGMGSTNTSIVRTQQQLEQLLAAGAQRTR